MHITTRWRLLGAAVAVLVCLMLVAGPAVAQDDDEQDASGGQTWSVQPAAEDGADGRAAFEYELEPGERADDFAQVNNFGEQELTFRVYSHDALNTPEGAFTLQPADAEPEQVGAWIGLDEQVTVQPGENVVVPFTLTVPDDATPGDHAGGIVASVTSEGTDDAGNRVLVDNRVGSRVYLRVAGDVDPVLAVTQLQAGYERSSWVPFSTGTVTVTYLVRNTGNVRLSGDQELTVHGLLGLGQRAVTLDELAEILPGQQVAVTAEVDSVAPYVQLTNEVAVNPVPPETAQDPIPPVLATAAVSVWAVPWPELVILALLLLAFAGAWWRRRRRKRRETTMVDDAVAKAREQMRQQLDAESSSDTQATAETESDATTDESTEPVRTAEEWATESETTEPVPTATESGTAASSAAEQSANGPETAAGPSAEADAESELETKARRPG